jgi:DNA-binding LacI/PurR family transcriptional regulator
VSTVQECKEKLGILATKHLLKKIKNPATEIPLRTRMAPIFVPGETIASCPK